MTPLTRKLVRELWWARGQALAIALLVACAVSTFVGAMSTWQALQRSQQAYYAAYAFADVFVELRRAPEPVAQRLAAVPGVGEVETRVAFGVALEVPGQRDPASALLCSIPDDGSPWLGKLHIRAGRSIAPGADTEVLISEKFARANALQPGDRVVAVINGRRQELSIVGIALSPEHVFVAKPGAIIPDDAHYGILWMARTGLAAALDLRNAFNSVAIRLAPGASPGPVIDEVDRILGPWGGLGAFGRDLHPSHRFVSDEISQLRALAATVPTVFLGVAAFLLGVVLSRLIAAQRMHIGTLRALGYGSTQVGVHYALFALAIVLAGSVAGIGGGFVMGKLLSRVYAEYYRFPVLLYRATPGVAALATALSVAAGLGGVASAVRSAVRLAPAEAMRPEAPPTFRPTILERLGISRLLSPFGRMVLRHIGRRPIRTLLSCSGIAAAVGIMVVAWFTRDAATLVLRQYFDVISREDVSVTFTDAVDRAALRELRALPGVVSGEGWRGVAAKLRAGHRSYRTALVGIEPGAELKRVVEAGGQVVAVPQRGVLLSRRIADLLDVRAGDSVRVELLEGTRRARDITVAGTVDDLLGVQATTSLDEIARLTGEGPRLSGAWLTTDPVAQGRLFARLRAFPRVSSVSLRAASLASLEKMLADSLLWFTTLLTAFAVVIACGVVYNAARLALAERDRELATLRVIGFTRNETWRLLMGEIAIEVAFAIPLGFAVGWAFTQLTVRATASDLMRLPAQITRANCAVGALVVVGASLAVGLYSFRWLARLDLVSVLKAKE